MELSPLDELSAQIRKLSNSDQDYLASMLLMERLKRNKLVMPTLHKRIDDAEVSDWKSWDKVNDAK
ncbi:hypothetical protein OAI07_00515 [Akkermansiaceae bacterium]|nr:hypothetical protein [Akkermansiaceae bacterium]